MSTTEAVVRMYPSAGYPPETGMPQGSWIGIVRNTGDGSGKDNARLLFSQAGSALNSNFYSIEQLGLTNGVSTAIGYIVNVENMLGEFALDDTVGIWRNQNMTDQLDIDLTIPISDMHFPLRWWIGRQNTPLVAASLTAISASVLNTVTTFWAGGYMWGPGAQNAVGGMKYPTNAGMWG